MSGEQKTMNKSFVYGVVTGLVVIGVLGGIFMLGAKYGNRSGDTSGNTAPTNGQPSPTNPTANQPQLPQADASKIAKVTSADHIRGTGKVTMIEYSDFQCPYCARFFDTTEQVLAAYKGKVRLVYRHFPLRSIHPEAQKAAEASECAAAQGKFWEMHDKLFELNKAGTLSVATEKQAAASLKLDTAKFNTCLDNGQMASVVEKDYQDGIAGGVSGTPGTFVNSDYIPGALPYEEIKPILDKALAS